MKKQNVLITGASRGLGLELANRLLNSGNYNVFGTATSQQGFDNMDEIGIEPYICDFRDDSSIITTINDIGKKVDNLDWLINNVGIRSRNEGLEDLTVDSLRDVMDVNFIGQFVATREAEKYMNQGGNIVFSSSIAAYEPCATAIGYTTSKAATLMLAESCRFPMSQKNIGVSNLLLGGMNTNFHSSQREELMSPQMIADIIYEQLFEGNQRGDMVSKDLEITSEEDNRRPIQRNIVTVKL